jgi:hypothetical protein
MDGGIILDLGRDCQGLFAYTANECTHLAIGFNSNQAVEEPSASVDKRDILALINSFQRPISIKLSPAILSTLAPQWQILLTF